MADAVEMIWELRWVGRPAGTHFSESTRSVLAFRDGANTLKAHAQLGPVVKRAPGQAKLAAAVVAGVAIGATAVAVVSKTKARIAEPPSADALPIDGFCVAVDEAVGGSRSMTGAEAERRILEVLLSAAIIASNLRALAGVRVVDASPQLSAAMSQLTAPDLTDTLNRMIAAEPALLDAEKSAAFFELFAAGRAPTGELVPLRHEAVIEALLLPGTD